MDSSFSTPISAASASPLGPAAAAFFTDMGNLTQWAQTADIDTTWLQTNTPSLGKFACTGTYWECGSCATTTCFIYDRCTVDCETVMNSVRNTQDAGLIDAFGGAELISIQFLICGRPNRLVHSVHGDPQGVLQLFQLVSKYCEHTI